MSNVETIMHGGQPDLQAPVTADTETQLYSDLARLIKLYNEYGDDSLPGYQLARHALSLADELAGCLFTVRTQPEGRHS